MFLSLLRKVCKASASAFSTTRTTTSWTRYAERGKNQKRGPGNTRSFLSPDHYSRPKRRVRTTRKRNYVAILRTLHTGPKMIKAENEKSFQHKKITWEQNSLFLLRNKHQEYNNLLTSFATCLCRQRIGNQRTAQLRRAFRAPRGHDFALMGLAFFYAALPTCLVVYVQKSDFHLINMFCAVIVVKNVLCLAQVVFSYFVLHSSKIPLVLTTKAGPWPTWDTRRGEEFSEREPNFLSYVQ